MDPIRWVVGKNRFFYTQGEKSKANGSLGFVVVLFTSLVSHASNSYDPVYKDEIQALYCGQNPPAVLLSLDHTTSMKTKGEDTCTRTEEMLLTLLGDDAYGGKVTCNPEDPSAEESFTAPSVGLLEVLSGWVDIGVYLWNGRIFCTRGAPECVNPNFNLYPVADLKAVSNERRKTPDIDMYQDYLKKRVQKIRNDPSPDTDYNDYLGRRGLTPMLRSIIAAARTLNDYSSVNKCTSYTAVTLGDGRATVEKHPSATKPWDEAGIDACDETSLDPTSAFTFDKSIYNVACPVRYYADPSKFTFKEALHNNRLVLHGVGYDLKSGKLSARTFSDIEYVQNQMDAYSANGAKSVLSDDPEALYQTFLSQILVSLNSTLPFFSFSFANPALIYSSQTGYHENVIYESVFARPLTYGMWAGNIWKHCMVEDGSSLCGTGASSKNYLAKDIDGDFQTNSNRIDMWSEDQHTTSNIQNANVASGGLGTQMKENLLTLTRPVLSYNGSGAYKTIRVPVGAFESSAKADNQNNFGGYVFSNRFDSTLNYILGFNFSDTVSKSWGRWPLGGFVHSRGLVLKYKNSMSTILVIGGNDGMLHFVDDSKGQIYRSILPYDLLPRLEEFYRQPTDIELNSEEDSDHYSITKASNLVKYGVDGDLTLLHHDTNQDGMIENSEKAWILFGLGRGGAAYYALEVSQGPTLAPKLIAMNYPRFPSKTSEIASNGLSALRETWSSPTLSVHLESNTKKERDIAIVGSGHDKYYDRDYDLKGDIVYMPGESGSPHTEGPTIYSTMEYTSSCSDALSLDKTNQDRKGKLNIPKTETKLCNGTFYDASNGDGISQGKPGYPWYDAPVKISPSNHSISELTDDHEQGYISQSSCGSKPGTPSNYEFHKCDTSTCSCGYKCLTTYYTCYFYKKEYDYFYDLPTNDTADPDLEDEENTGTTKKMKLRLPQAFAYKVDFKYLDIGSGEIVQVKNELGEVLQTITGPNPVYDASGKVVQNVTSTNWIYAKKIVVKVITNGDNPNQHNQDSSYWGRGVQIGDIHYKQKLKKTSIDWSGLGPSLYILDLGTVDGEVLSTVSFNTDPDPKNSQIYKRFTKNCGLATHNCIGNSSDYPDLKYMNYPLSAKATVIQKGGFFFRAYIGDEGGQIWRVSYDRSSEKWRIIRVFKASKSTEGSSDREVFNVRKIFTQVDVAIGDCMQGGDSYAVFFGTGDPQRPRQEMSDVVGMFIDSFESSLNFATALTLDRLDDVTSELTPNFSTNSSYAGWYINAKTSFNETSLLNLSGGQANIAAFQTERGSISSSKMLRAPRVFGGKVYYKLYDSYGSCKPTNLCEGYPSSRNRLVVRGFCTGNADEGHSRDLGPEAAVGHDFMTFLPETGASILFVDGQPIVQRKQNLETLFLRKSE